jgi:DNA-binding CsgD family transcriptional regulator
MRLTDTQRAILVALCRSRAGGNRYATPATNQEIAGEVFLSVDAVKAHLRALYRKFGVEPLAHNQKRARLVELVMEGGLISPPEDGGAPSVEAAEPPPPPAVGREPAPAPERDREPSPPKGPRPKRRLIAAGLAAAGAIVLALLLTGAFSGGSSGRGAEEASTPAAYRAAVNGYCRLALEGQPEQAGASRAERARGYLGVIELMSGRLESLTPPSADNRDLALFRNGLVRAADYTDLIAQGPPAPGSRESANAVAELTLAAGQVQAGALGYHLSRDCSAIGSLVIARSARNAAVGP